MDTRRKQAQGGTATPTSMEGNQAKQSRGAELLYERPMNIKMPAPAEYIPVEVVTIDRILQQCESVKKKSYSWAELLQTVSFFFFGLIFSAIMSGIAYGDGWKSLLFYTISPAIAIGTLVAYLFCRQHDFYDGRPTIETIGERLTDALTACKSRNTSEEKQVEKEDEVDEAKDEPKPQEAQTVETAK